MISVRRIAIAVGTVVAVFAVVVFAVALKIHAIEYPIDWYDAEPLKPVVVIFAVMAIVPRWRRYLATAVAIVTAALLLFLIHAIGSIAYSLAPGLFDVLAVIFLLAALAAFTRGRLPMLAPVAIVTASVLALMAWLLLILVFLPFEGWTPPTWDDPQHQHALRVTELCRGLTLFDPKLYAFPHASIEKITSNFRGEHRPMVLLRGKFRKGFVWLPPEALARMMVDDRDPALHPCEGAGRHPLWSLGAEAVSDRLDS